MKNIEELLKNIIISFFESKITAESFTLDKCCADLKVVNNLYFRMTKG
jgi:hypothetical protein